MLKQLSKEEIESIQDGVNSIINKGIEAVIEIMNIDDAKARGAMALFGEKYGDVVRVVSFEDESIELCGGTHVKNSADIGMFFIISY